MKVKNCIGQGPWRSAKRLLRATVSRSVVSTQLNPARVSDLAGAERLAFRWQLPVVISMASCGPIRDGATSYIQAHQPREKWSFCLLGYTKVYQEGL